VAPAAAAWLPVRRRCGWRKAWRGKVLQVTRKVLACVGSLVGGRGKELTQAAVATMEGARQGRLGMARGRAGGD
jgi:hypothetical protein